MPSKLNDPAPAIVLVTGIGGFLGGHIAKQLLAPAIAFEAVCAALAFATGSGASLVPMQRPKRSALSRRIFAPMPDGISRLGDAATLFTRPRRFRRPCLRTRTQ